MMKYNRNVLLKSLTLLLCFYIAVIPFFQPKKIYASMSDKIVNFTRVVGTVIFSLQSVGFISKTALTPENLENIYNKADAYLHENFGTELEYAEALRQVDQLGLDIASGKIFVPGNYSGKLWYSFLNAVVDIVYPDKTTPPSENYEKVWAFLSDGKTITYKTSLLNTPIDLTVLNPKLIVNNPDYVLFSLGNLAHYNVSPGNTLNCYFYYKDASGKSLYNEYWFNGYMPSPADKDKQLQTVSSPTYWKGPIMEFWKSIFLGTYGNMQFIPSIKEATAKKVKLPTRLPQTVINNINNYIDGSSENLIVNPTPDELPTLPDNYNPNTDDPPDLPGYEDVTPDQPGTTDPQPTPSPTPEPTPTLPEYDGSSWIKPIGDFFAGLLSFLKDALIPTQTVDFSPLQNMGADVSSKFPFSLPGDIGKLFGVLNAEPIRPHFEMDFDLSKVGIPGEPIHWDLNVEQWDNGAAVVKTALYIAFLIGLVFITKQFMQN